MFTNDIGSMTSLQRDTPSTTASPETGVSQVSERGVTFRAVTLGLSIVVLINLWVTYSVTMAGSSRLNLNYFQLTLLFCFILLVAVVNPIFKLIQRGFAFSPSELLAIVAIGIVGSVTPASGITGFFLGIVGSPFYYAAPENQWSDFYYPHLSSWMVPTDREALRAFYEGLPRGAEAPWGVWVVPLAWWGSVILAILVACACLMVILRKQWVEHEKLVFPMVEVPIELARNADSERLFPDVMRQKLFWGAALAALALFVWESLSWIFPGVPDVGVLPSGGVFRFTRYSPAVNVRPLQFYTLGFAYFANLEVLFSVWFFFLVHVVEGHIFNRLGLQVEKATDSFTADQEIQAWQCFGALACMVIWRLWVSRSHLREVFLKALDRRYPADDRQEILSYRTAVAGLLLSLAYILFLLNQSGMDFVTALIFIVGTGIIYVGMARVVSEAGLATTQAPITAQAFVMDMRGTEVMSGATLTSILLSYSLIDYIRGLFTPGLAQSVKLGDLIRRNRRILVFWVCLGALAGLASSVWFTLYLGHIHGAHNFARFARGNPKGVFSSTLAQMKSPQPPQLNRMFFFGIGAALMGLLTYLRYRFAWWSIHPLGLAISASDNSKSIAIPVFMVWALKLILIRMGGVSLYQRAKPFFLGLLVGYTLGVVWCFCVDLIWFPGHGHGVHAW